jgi:N-acetylneuraminic acid mutarotase
MKSPRSTGFSLIFKSKIYIFGGYTGDQKRSKSIEVYDPAKNYWESLNVRIPPLRSSCIEELKLV